ncbi:sodium channel protein 1 brain-like [Montipora capricornis]|uniref:sodium channel protein 1 brain-like n=2 Tax=Montipora capricornis TaxID=246305 RepID=UPI0035F1D11A
MFVKSSLIGRTEKSAPIKEPGRKEQPDSSKGEGSSVKRVHFEDEEMERKSENSESSDEDVESAKVVRVPSFFISKPLVDFDAGIGRVPCNHTFIVIRRRGKSRSDQVYRFSKAPSLGLLEPLSPVRRFAISVVTNRYFESFVILTILANCVFLVIECAPEEAEYVFCGIYTLEMCLKILSRGFIFHAYAYLRDAWNWLDFLVVVLGYVTVAPNIANLTGIRTVRVLRALRTFSALKGLRAMVNTLLRSLKLLSDVMVLFLFFLGVMALIGLQLFSGELRNKCILNTPNGNLSVNLKERALNQSFWFIHEEEPLVCGNGSTAGSCPVNYTCMANAGPNPDHGYTTFDNIGWSLVMALQILTMDYWENLYDKIIRSSGALYVPYFIIGIFFCSFYLMNLVLAVVYLSYELELCSEEKEKEKRILLRRTGSTYQADRRILKRLIPLDGSKPPEPKSTTIDGGHAVEIGDALEDGDLKEGSSTKENEAEKRAEFSHCLLPGCVPRERAGLSVSKSNGVLRVISWWKWIRQSLKDLTSHSAFDVVIVTLILLNTIVLALYHHGIDPEFRQVLDNINLAFTAMFALEILFRFVAVGPIAFMLSRWNVFDTTVVAGSLLGYFYKSAEGLSVFRTLRLIRVLCLAKSWKTMERLMKAIARSVEPVGNITLILSVVMYIFAVLGIKVFGKAYTEDKFGEEGVPRWNFNDFWHAVMMVFRVLCGEWIEPLWGCMRDTSPGKAILFFLAVLVVGNFIVLNLFVALLVNAFDFRETDNNDDAQSVQNPSRFSVGKLLKTRKSCLFVAKYRESFRLYELQVLESSHCPDVHTGGSLAICEPERDKSYEKQCGNTTGEGSLLEIEDSKSINKEEADPTSGVDMSPSGTLTRGCKMDRDDQINAASDAGMQPPRPTRYTIEIDDCLPEYCVDCPLWKPFSPRHFCWLKFRCRVRFLVEKKYFEWFILATVFFSSFTLIFEDIHLHEKPKLQTTLEILNYVFAAIFTAEFVLKVIGFGLVKYFSSPWNCLDAFIVSISLACVFEDKNLSVFRSLRTLRALRPLRAISRLEGMRVVVNALFAAIPGIGNVLLVSLLFWLIFSILGVHIFAGKFYKCVDKDNKPLPASVVPSKTKCLANPNGYRWVNSKVTFDNVFAGFLALMQVATFEGWMEVMQDAVDSTDVDMQPQFENKLASYCFFVAFIVVGSFFVLNLFVGVIIDNFNSLKKKYEELNSMGMLLTDTQRKWVNFLKEAARKKPPSRQIRPQERLCGVLYDVVMGDKFEIAIMTVIMCNMVLMTIQHHGQSKEITEVLRIANFVFTGIFVLEAIVKIVTLRTHYFKKPWNVFDFLIVLSSLVDVMLVEFNANEGTVSPSLLRVLRIFRIARLLRLVEFAKGIRKLLWALMISLPALFNIGTLLFMVMFIYAIIGMSAFGNVKREGELSDTVNFETFASALLLLFRLSTGSGWNDIMDALLLEPPNCDPDYLDLPNGNCGSFGAIIYLASYIIVVFLVIVNMYIAIILENVNRAHEIEDFCITKENFDSYYTTWGIFVHDGKPYLPLAQLSDFVASLGKPFTISQPNLDALRDMDIPVRSGDQIHCFDLLKALVRRVLEDHGESVEVFKDITLRMEATFNKSFISQKRISSFSGSTKTKLSDDFGESIT